MSDHVPDLHEGDQARGAENDNSTGRLLALSDGVFAIAMTLLALDLRLPALPDSATDAMLRDALADNWQAYLSFAISFYVVAGYWATHRRMMRTITVVDGRLIGHTMSVLLLVAALPFPASVLGADGGLPSALALYGVYNVVVSLALLRLRADVRRCTGTQPDVDPLGLWADIGVFLLCVPAAYVLEDKGPFLLLLLVVSGRGPAWWRARQGRLTA